MSYETYNWFAFWSFVVIALALFYQSWLNLAKGQLTGFSMDALMLFYLRITRGSNAVTKAKKLLYKEPKRIRILGIFALCGAVTTVYIATDWFLKYLVSN